MKSLASIFLSPPSQEFRQWRACAAKRRFTKANAEKDASRINHKNEKYGDGKKVVAYECENCFQWHVGGIK